eukprot:gene23776-1493_t
MFRIKFPHPRRAQHVDMSRRTNGAASTRPRTPVSEWTVNEQHIPVATVGYVPKKHPSSHPAGLRPHSGASVLTPHPVQHPSG